MMRIATAAVVLVGLTGAAQAQHAHGMQATSPSEGAATRGYKAAHQAMMSAMSAPYTGDPDVDFRVQMIPHHEGAIAMAKVALLHGKDPSTRVLAEALIREQEREIAEMKSWLRARGR